MKKLIFENITLVSYREKKARKEKFHPQKNLIVGRNHTGKSSLLKTLFLTLGAKANGKLEYWDQNTVSIVSLRIDDIRYQVCHQYGNRALFNADGEILAASVSHQDWTNEFALITGFNLPLTDKNIETVNADVKCFFLPFYLDQDSSWGNDWNTFAGLQQYKAPVLSILEYFSGIKPPEYYSLNAEKKQKQTELNDLKKDMNFLDRAKKRLESKLDFNCTKIDFEAFEIEIEQLTTKVNTLNSEQEALREKLVSQKEMIDSITAQIESSQFALGTYSKDSTFLSEHADVKLSCPTCGAEHSDPFLEFLTYAEDDRVLRELISRLRNDLSKLQEEYKKSNSNLAESRLRYDQITEILNTKRGEVKLKDIIDIASVEKALFAFHSEEQTLKEDIVSHSDLIAGIEKKINGILDKKRTKLILEAYRAAYKNARFKLNLPPIEVEKLKLNSRPDLSGSGGPRAILAYYYALWSVCHLDSGSYNVPIIIDSPNQKGQDNLNMPIILKFISEELPLSAQIIIGSEIDTEYRFDKVFELEVPYSLLKEELFSDLKSEADTFLKKMYVFLETKSKEHVTSA